MPPEGPLMFAIVAGGGKVGSNVARTLLRRGHEVTLIEQIRERYERLEQEFEHQVHNGDATELFVLERAGIGRPADIVIAVTGDDEDNLIIGQLAREKYAIERVIARVNDPRNQQLFDLLGIQQTVSATQMVLGLIEHEVPAHKLIHLLELRKENLEIVEVEVEQGAPAAGKRVEQLSLPESARLISVMRNGKAEIAVGQTRLEPGDQVLAILQPGREEELRQLLLRG
jgi:trk system potassium uptake protein